MSHCPSLLPRWNAPANPVPANAGIGLKFEHAGEIIASVPGVGWFEVHAENYMGAGGAPHHQDFRAQEHRVARQFDLGVERAAGPVEDDGFLE